MLKFKLGCYTQSRQKSYADKRRDPLQFKVGDFVYLRVSPTRGVQRFGIKEKLAPRYIGPFEIIKTCGPVAYRIRLPSQLAAIHDVFHVGHATDARPRDDVPKV